MKSIIKAVVLGVLVSAAQGAFADAFPAAAETNVGQPALDTYADRHAREGTLLQGSGSAIAMAAETNVGQPALDTYADANARKGDVLGSADSPFPIAADVDMSKWSFDARASA